MMREFLLLPPLLLVPACATTTPPVPHAPPEEAAQVEFPRFGVPEEGAHRLQGNMAAAIQLAMDEFLPRRSVAPTRSPERPPCLSRLDSYEVAAAPAPDGVILVEFTVNPEACETGESVTDVTTYAVDSRTRRLLSVEWRTRQRLKSPGVWPGRPLPVEEAPPAPPPRG